MYMKKIYLDNAAGTAVRKEVLQEMVPYFSEKYANPSALHDAGLEVKKEIATVRSTIMNQLSCDSVIFTSGGTESINLALQGILTKGDHIITTTIEHKAVLETCRYLENKGVQITYLAVDSDGLVNVDAVVKALKKKTKLVSIQYVNNETGVIQPIQKIAKKLEGKNVLFHTDACQAGFLELDMKKLGVDLMTLNGSKMYGPKGVGVLAICGSVELKPLLHGGNQEDGLRAGTENVPAIIGFGKALELAQISKEKYNAKMKKLRRYFIAECSSKIDGIVVNGNGLFNIVNITFSDVNGETLLLYLNNYGIYASSGSACSSGEIGVSHVLTAMGLSGELASSTIRFSFGKDTTKKELQEVVSVLDKVISSLRKL